MRYPSCDLGTPRKKKSFQFSSVQFSSVQLFNLISFLEPPGLDSELLALPVLDSGLPKPKKKETLSVQFFKLISFLEPPGLDSRLISSV